MGSKINLEEEYLTPSSKKNYKRTGFINLKWLSRIIICLLIFCIVWSAQQSNFIGSHKIRQLINYTFTTNYNLYPVLQKISNQVSWEDIFKPVSSKSNFTDPNKLLNTNHDAEKLIGELNFSKVNNLKSLFQFIYPVAAGKVIARYDPQGREDTSYGIIIQTFPGQSVRAAYKGRVVSVTGDRENGYMILLDHGQNVFSTTMGNIKVQVRPDDEIETGQILGYLNTNNAEPQLYFEVRVQGRPVDPLIFIENN